MVASEGGSADGLAVARRMLVFVLAAEIGVLVLSGLWLVFNYRPSGAIGVSVSGARSVTRVSWIQATHRLVSSLALITSVAAGAAMIADALVREDGRRRLALLVIGPALVLAVAAAGFTGYLLPWDVLSLRAVVVGSG
jgi:quinol-cytochrome oxidoreductase complex cytochrome b subunit